ncbi:hypothetical protein J7T55_003856 [Diaporthe amygdali]|uniref:uncharacterized protein n=1 Tax=Phomopsis amygdali TaxID=1214568 RepID=UPI0022FE0844|nr:uncharacterized protein J7T55_003856 [Diaporthe amygdali]KAJ0117442.1 hypothetical protein J7T55_003856 [Diaporthe amygdali]
MNETQKEPTERPDESHLSTYRLGCKLKAGDAAQSRCTTSAAASTTCAAGSDDFKQSHDLDGGDLSPDNTNQRTDSDNRHHDGTNLHTSINASDDHREYTNNHIDLPGRQSAYDPDILHDRISFVDCTNEPLNGFHHEQSLHRQYSISSCPIEHHLACCCIPSTNHRSRNYSGYRCGSRGIDSVRRPSGRGGDMHKSLMSEAESMAYTASPVDVKPQMASVQPSRGLSQNPVFMAPYSRPNSWRTWRPSATFAQGLEPLPDDIQLPPPPPHALTRNSAFPRTSEVSTGADSSMPEYAWHTASNADLTGLAPAPAQALAPEYVGGPHEPAQDWLQQTDGHGSYVTYSDTPLATPRTPMVVEGEQLAPLATSQEASPVDNDDGSGESGDATRSDSWGARGGSSGGGNDEHEPEGGIQEAQLGRQAGEGGSHGGGPEGLKEESPREQGKQTQQGQQDESGERDEQVFEEVEAVERQPSVRLSSRLSSHAPSSWDGESDADFSWSEAASEPYTAPRDGFGLSIIGARRASRSGTGGGDPRRP